jgi:hypothetical protein
MLSYGASDGVGWVRDMRDTVPTGTTFYWLEGRFPGSQSWLHAQAIRLPHASSVLSFPAASLVHSWSRTSAFSEVASHPLRAAAGIPPAPRDAAKGCQG